MAKRPIEVVSCALLTALLATLTARAHGESRYTVTPLGSLGGRSLAFGLNDNGQVVGSAALADGGMDAFLWQPQTGMVDLGTLPGDDSASALSIDNSGQITGGSQAINVVSPKGGGEQGFLWESGTGMIDIGAGNNLSYVSPLGITQQGQAYGGTSVGGFIYSIATGLTQPTAPGAPIGLVLALNCRGQMAVRTSDSDNVLFITPGSAPVEIKGPGNLVSGAALGMSEDGTVVGFIDPSDGEPSHAYLWNQATGLTDLGPGEAEAINDLDQAVGIKTVADGSGMAFLYDNGTSYDLAALLDTSGAGWSGLFPKAVNDLGQIAGYGTFNGQTEAFLLTPVSGGASSLPEPTTLSLFALAAVPMLLRRARGGARRR